MTRGVTQGRMNDRGEGQMSHKRLTTWQKATALVPLALLSGAWTTSLTLSGSASAATEHGPKLPDGSSVPTTAIKAPASVSVPGEIAPGVPAGAAQSVIDSASTSGIPAAALAAYQRAAQVIDAADPSCHLDWPLIAAIGRVESDHGRYGGNTLGSDGISKPGIFGIPLDGSNGTAKVSDTDAGQFDDDPVYDRAVGPMQFIPSTWSVVGVDGDGDGRRNPQDINDAALATAVYLCSGNEDLSTPAGQRSAVYRYNHSQDYVNLVLSIMRAYAQGDYAAVPNGSAAPTTFTPYFGSVATPGTGGAKKKHHAKSQHASSDGTKSTGSSTGSVSGTSSTGGSSQPTAPSTPSAPSSDPTKTVKKATDTVTKAAAPVQKVLVTTAQATDLCTAELKKQYGSAPQQAVDACVADLQGKTLDEAKAAVPGVVSGLSGLVSDLLGGVTGGLTGGSTGGTGGLLGN